jgi:hypothetical protein
MCDISRKKAAHAVLRNRSLEHMHRGRLVARSEAAFAEPGAIDYDDRHRHPKSKDLAGPEAIINASSGPQGADHLDITGAEA